MRIELIRRDEVGAARRALASVLALLAAFLVAGIVVWLMGRSPLAALRLYLLEPVSDAWALQELAVKATPLVLIAVGLSYCFRANLWNIGAEGQYLMGALAGSSIAIATHGGEGGSWVLPAMLLLGAAGGALWGLIPAALRVTLGVSEILTSLMLVYVARLTVEYLARGPWRDPKAFGFPGSVRFDEAATLPTLDGGRLHLGVAFALVAVIATALVASRTLFGYRLRVSGEAPRAARFAGFRPSATTLVVFALSGALAGLAGIVEVSGPIGQVQPGLSANYGFVAITVAFLGRLGAFGMLAAGLVVAMTVIGGERAQIELKLPFDLTTVFQGVLLLFVLVADQLAGLRLRLRRDGG
jgi:general nucleoside transport system permease protein